MWEEIVKLLQISFSIVKNTVSYNLQQSTWLQIIKSMQVIEISSQNYKLCKTYAKVVLRCNIKPVLQIAYVFLKYYIK